MKYLFPESHISSCESKKTPLKSIDSIEPCDGFEGENDNAYIPELDDAWGTESAVEKEANESTATSLNNLPYNFLLGMPNLQILAVKDLTWLEQLQKLVDLTPSLEELRCGGRRVIVGPLDVVLFLFH